jgi:type IV pilus assembly protein PilE
MTHRNRNRRQAGFTLIELMVALAIVSILMAVAYPAYQNQVAKSRRADAQAVLMEATQFLERFATMNMRYDRDVAGAAVALPAQLTKAPKDGASKYYTISIQSVAQNTYTLQAVPSGVQSGDLCGTFTVNNVGVRAAAKTDCWRR